MLTLTSLRQVVFVSFLLLTVWYLGCQSESLDSNGVTTPEDEFTLGSLIEPPDETDSAGEPEGDDSLGTEGQGAPPIVEAGESQVVFSETLVILDGSGSDPDGDPLTLTWTQTAGPSVSWNEALLGIISFIAPDVDEDTHLEFTLSVSDGTFSVEDTVSVDVMNTLTPADVGLPDVRFTVLLEGEADPDVPLDGLRPLNVICTAATMDGHPLPNGTFSWMFDSDAVESGSVDTYAVRNHIFTSAGVHSIALSLTVAGMTVGCVSNQTGQLEQHITVWPLISGKVEDDAGTAMTSVVVSANGGGTTAVTDSEGTYTIQVPYKWSGTVTAQHADYEFATSSISYTGVEADLASQVFKATLRLPRCVGDTPCDDALFCNGAERCVNGACQAGSNPCPGQSCDENTDACINCLVDTDCDDGNPCTDDSCDPNLGCVNTPNDANSCDDGLLCNGTETCDANGRCVSDAAPGCCATDEDCDTAAREICTNNQCVAPCPGDAECDNGVFCDGFESCDAGACVSSGNPCSGGEICDEGAAGCIPPGSAVPFAHDSAPEMIRGVRYGTLNHVRLSATDADGDALTFRILSLPTNTQLFDEADDGTPVEITQDMIDLDPSGYYTLLRPQYVTYRPAAGGGDSGPFTWQATDGLHDSNVATVTPTFVAWYPPIGIPEPEFGIHETHWMYQLGTGEDCTTNPEKCYDFGNGLEPYPDAGNGPYTHYIDNSGSCNNSNNDGFGSPTEPLCTIPRGLSAGSVVEVHGGPYNSSPFQENWSGTVQSPIFIVGVDIPRFTDLFPIYNSFGARNAYVIVDGLSLHGFIAGEGSHHIVLRNCDQYSRVENPTTGVGITPGLSVVAEGFVVFNNVIHDNGIWDPEVAVGDRDYHGMGVGGFMENVWIIDNDIFHNEGDSIQINSPRAAASYIYVGRNKLHHNKQSGIAIKVSDHVIISQNEAYGIRASSSSPGAGMAFSDGGPAACWFLYNRIHDNTLGFKLSEYVGVGGPHGLIGNVIYDIHEYGGGGGMAVIDYHWSPTKYIVANTIYDTDYGYYIEGVNWTQPLLFANNVFSQMAVSGAPMILVDHGGSTGIVTVTNNLFDGAFRIQWGGANYTSLPSFQAATGQGVGCLVGDARFRDPAQADFHLLSDSPAVDAGDAGVAHDAYDTFLNLYGIDIRVDIEGMSIPVDGNGDGSAVTDMGAHEYRRP